VPFVHRVVVQPADIDNLQHVSNLVYLRWVQEAAIAHSTALGFDEAAYLARGEVWVVRRHELDYLAPARDREELLVETRIATLGAANSVRKTQVLRAADRALLCRAATDWVYFDLARGRPKRIPPDLRARFPLEPD
jgi:acyl-CoA thioester hydrolase